MKVSEPPIIVRQQFNQPAKVVWKAITDINQMQKWFFDNILDFKPEVGFKTSFAVSNEGRTFTHLWEVTEVIPLKKIKYNWKYAEYSGDSFVIFELEDHGEQTTLTLTTEITEDFPNDIPEFKRESCIGGWNYFIGESLNNFLKGSKTNG